eukprot:Sdes_comp10044_c0_seq1m1638
MVWSKIVGWWSPEPTTNPKPQKRIFQEREIPEEKDSGGFQPSPAKKAKLEKSHHSSGLSTFEWCKTPLQNLHHLFEKSAMSQSSQKFHSKQKRNGELSSSSDTSGKTPPHTSRPIPSSRFIPKVKNSDMDGQNLRNNLICNPNPFRNNNSSFSFRENIIAPPSSSFFPKAHKISDRVPSQGYGFSSTLDRVIRLNEKKQYKELVERFTSFNSTESSFRPNLSLLPSSHPPTSTIPFTPSLLPSSKHASSAVTDPSLGDVLTKGFSERGLIADEISNQVEAVKHEKVREESEKIRRDIERR